MNRDKLAYDYILAAIDFDGYELDVEPVTDEEKLLALDTVFRIEYGFMVDRVGYQQAMAEWISGLPSCFNIEYRNDEILFIAKKWNSLAVNATEAQQDKILNNWFNYIAAKTGKFIRKAH